MSLPARLLTYLFGLAAWAAAAWGAAQVHRLDLPVGLHDLCGPWGCAPPPSALLGYHALWAVLLVPAAGLLCGIAPRARGLAAARWIALGGVLLAIGLFAVPAIAWARSEGTEHAVRRGLFALVTTPDAPAAPLVLAGVVGRLAVRRRATTDAAPEPVESAAAGRDN